MSQGAHVILQSPGDTHRTWIINRKQGKIPPFSISNKASAYLHSHVHVKSAHKHFPETDSKTRSTIKAPSPLPIISQ